MILKISVDKLLTVITLTSALVLPYVSFEPAPIDYVLVLLAAIYLATGGVVSRNALIIVGVYLAFYFASGISSVVHDRVNSEKFARYYFVEVFLIFTTLMAYSIFKSKPYLAGIFLKYYCIGAIISCIVVLLVYYGAPSYEGIYRDSTRIRIKGFFKDPNVLGPFLIFPLLVLIFSPDRIDLKIIWRLGIIPIFAVLFMTYSRAALGGFLISVFAFIFIKGLFGASRSGIIVSFLSVIVFLLVLSTQIERIYHIFSELDTFRSRMVLHGYDQSRFYDIGNALYLGASTLFGLGPASYETMFNALSPHNLFVAKLVDGGWVPALIVSWFMFYPIWIALKMFFKWRDDIFLVLFCVLLAHFVMAMVINTHHWRHLLLLCAIIFAMPETYYSRQPLQENARKRNVS
jgi:hypothetical protein